jgi:hypothetical protein
VDLSVAYWRKANQIHAWFVEHVQDGEDECREHSVSKEQLQTLCDLCQQVLDTKNASLLPPRPGFFFGSTDIDDYYWQDLKYTIDQLKPLLEDPRFQGWDFTYQSSW